MKGEVSAGRVAFAACFVGDLFVLWFRGNVMNLWLHIGREQFVPFYFVKLPQRSLRACGFLRGGAVASGCGHTGTAWVCDHMRRHMQVLTNRITCSV